MCSIWSSRILVLTALCCSSLIASEFEAHYLFSTPSTSDPGNEIIEHEALAKASFDVVPFGPSGRSLTVGGYAKLNDWEFDDPAVPDVRLYKLAASFKSMVFLHPTFGFYAALEPGLHTDFENVSADDIRIEGNLLGIYVASPELQVVAGAAYTDEFGKARVFPVVGAIWDASDRLHIEAIIPSLSATYNLSEHWRSRAAVMAAGGEWNWTFSTPSDDDEIDAQLSSFRAEAGIDRLVAANSWLGLTVGYEFARKVTLKRADGIGPEPRLDLVDSAYGAIGFTSKL